jgi:cytochrome b6-f complex iron-sulfur subunit
MESETQEPQGEGVQGQSESTDVSAQRAPAPTVDTPVAAPVPRRNVLTRRLFILGGFWSTLTLAFVGLVGPSLDFAWPRRVAGESRKVLVSADRVPAPGDDPVIIPEGRFYLVNLPPGTTPNGEETQGGLLALWQKCPHLGCTVPWRGDFSFRGRTGWFRCPCHGSTYTREGGVLVFGPAPRPLDRFEIEPRDDGSVVVTIGVKEAVDGSPDNPSKAVSQGA